MGIIRQLSPSVINQIAAGEVVERPASVVKELLENAIDAGATRVDLSVERGGKDLVRVADNGQGMEPDDLLARLPAARDEQARRGRRPASAIDNPRLPRRGPGGDRRGRQGPLPDPPGRRGVRFGNHDRGRRRLARAGRARCPPGTVIEVRNLFFNTPVRRTFLKSDATEAGHVAEMFARIALAHPTVHLTYRSGGQGRPRPAAGDGHPRADRRLLRPGAGRRPALGREPRSEQTHLWGYVGHPSQSRSSNKGQYLFVGGRYVRDRSLAHALTEAYRGLLMVGRQSVAFLHLEVPPEEVDVNVHPTKIEVRFRDGHRIYSQLLSTVRQTFLASDLHSRLQAAGAADRIRRPSRHPSPPRRSSCRSRRSIARRWRRGSRRARRRSSRSHRPATRAGRRPGPLPRWAANLPPAPIRQAGFDEFADDGIAGRRRRSSPSRPRGADSRPARPPLKAIQVHDTLPGRRDRRRHGRDRSARAPRADPLRGIEGPAGAGGRRVAAAARARAGRPGGGRGGGSARAEGRARPARPRGRAVRRRHRPRDEHPGDAPRRPRPTGCCGTSPTISARRRSTPRPTRCSRTC